MTVIAKDGYSKMHKELYAQISNACLIFHVWKTVRGTLVDETILSAMKQDDHFWDAVAFSLQRAWLTVIANFFEKTKYNQGDEVVVSVYSLLNITDIKTKMTIEQVTQPHLSAIHNIQKFRHKFLAHNDFKASLNVEGFKKKYPFDLVKDGENLLQLSIKILSELDATKAGYIYKPLINDIERQTKLFMKKIKYIEKERQRVQGEFLNGKRDRICHQYFDEKIP